MNKLSSVCINVAVGFLSGGQETSSLLCFISTIRDLVKFPVGFISVFEVQEIEKLWTST